MKFKIYLIKVLSIVIIMVKDNYKRPEKTFQDTLENDDIKEMLKDYVDVDDIYSVSLNTHIRYFIKKNGKRLFRMGGNIIKMDEQKGYIVLSNGKTNWSVQVKDAIFFKKPNVEDVKAYYEEKLKKYKKKIRKLEESLEEIKRKLKEKNRK